MKTSFILIIVAYLFSIGSAEDFLQCPSISDGYHPFCECKHGPMYDIETNTCPNPECPVDDSTGTYPNCTCSQRNFDYSIYLNECFRVCPDNSSGYWPKCDCDSDGFVFDKAMFECLACPVDSTGLYPDCVCKEDSAAYTSYNNLCQKCEAGSFGIFPNCSCSDGAMYDIYSNICVQPFSGEVPVVGCMKNGDDGNNENFVPDYGCLQCPFGSNGTYPNCICDEDSLYDKSNNLCNSCPFGSDGVYPNCICDGNGTYNATSNFCNLCPFESDGVYPDCICQNPGSSYIMDLNWCYACPSESTGEYPNCQCEPPSMYVKDNNVCVSCPENGIGVYPNCECLNGFFSLSQSSCIECPIDSIGLYPDCKCHDEKMLFSAYINQCYLECPENTTGIHPNCQCFGGYFYEANEFDCKSNIGRKCPVDSIGIGPDCLCMRKNEKFNSYYWDCMPPGAGFASVSTNCPDGNGKWPQCEASIDVKTLMSLVG